jgi:glycosyltransferase involved in cell wall biosynthesis
MSRVLLVSNHGWTVYNFRRSLIRHLERLGHEVFVQTEFDGYEAKLGLHSRAVLELDIDRTSLNPWSDGRTAWSIYRAIGAVHADVCLFFNAKPVVYGGFAAALRSVPFISNVAGLGAAFLGPAWLRALARMLYRVGLAKASHVFFQNPDDYREFERGGLVKTSVASLLPGSGVDLTRFRTAPFPSNEQPVFLLVARLFREKGVREYVEAARIVRSRFPGTRFQLLGPAGTLNRSAISIDEVGAWVKEGSIEYLGQTDDVHPYLAAADCIVLPSYYLEGVPRTLLEAAAVGRPVITTDNVGCREAVVDDITGLVCRSRDAVDLAAAMARFIAMPVAERAEMGRRGRQRVEKAFDEHIVLGKYGDAIRAALYGT